MYNIFLSRGESKVNSVDISINSSDIDVDDNIDLTDRKFLRISKVEITSLEIPNIIYNINTTTMTTSLGSCTIEMGNYTPTTIAAEIQSKLQTVNAGFRCVYSLASRKIQISNISDVFTITGLPLYDLRFKEILGIGASTADIGPTVRYEFPNVSEPSVYSEFVIASNLTDKIKQSNILETDDGQLTILASIPILHESKILQIYDKYVSRPITFAQTIVINKLSLKLLDPATSLKANTGGLPWSCTLTLYGI